MSGFEFEFEIEMLIWRLMWIKLLDHLHTDKIIFSSSKLRLTSLQHDTTDRQDSHVHHLKQRTIVIKCDLGNVKQGKNKRTSILVQRIKQEMNKKQASNISKEL